MAIQLDEFGMSYSLALQKVIGETKRATTKHDRIHDDQHTPSEWTTMLNQRAQHAHAMALMIPLTDDAYEKELLAIAALATSALAAHERGKKALIR